MQAIKDFPAVDEGSSGNLLTFDVGDWLKNSGLQLSGTPTITATVASAEDGAIDAAPQSHVSALAIGTPIGPIGSGVNNGAMQCIFSGGVGNVTYLLYAKCATNVTGVYAELWAHLPCVTPN